MKTFLLEIIPRIKRFSKKLDDLTVITNQHWLLIDEANSEKTVFIFREQNQQLLISKNGKIEKGNWEYLGNNTLLIDRENGSYLFKQGFIDDSVLALKLDGTDEYALFVNERKIEEFYLNSIENILSFLRKEYVDEIDQKIINIKMTKPNENESLKKSKENRNHSNFNKELPLKYKYDSNDSETEFRLHKKDGKWGYIDKENNIVIDFLFDDAYPFSEELACVRINEKKGFINRKGKIVIEAIYDSASFFKNGQSEVSIGNESFFINLTGEKVKNT